MPSQTRLQKPTDHKHHRSPSCQWILLLTTIVSIGLVPNGILFAANPTNRAYCPLFTSSDQGQSWHPVTFLTGRDWQVSFVKERDQNLFVATDNAGLWRVHPTAKTAESVGGNLPGPKITALEVTEQAIFVGVYQKGLYRSQSPAFRWQACNEGLADLRVQAILHTPTALWIGTDSGVFRAADPAQPRDWKQIVSGDQVISLALAGSQIIAGTTSGVLSIDPQTNALTWQHQAGALHNVAVYDKTVFAMYISGELWVSPDSGSQWRLAHYGPSAGSYIYELTPSGDALVMSNNYGVHRSVDGGFQWQLVSAREDIGFFDFLTTPDGTLYGGVRTWRERRGRTPVGDFQDPFSVQIPVP